MYAVVQVSQLALQAVLLMDAGEEGARGGEAREDEGKGLRPRSLLGGEDDRVEKGAGLEGLALPLAVVDAGGRQPVVLEVTEAAAREGVVAGLSVAQALARCGELGVRHRSPQAERMVEDWLFSLAYSLSPRVEREAPGAMRVDLQGVALGAALERCEAILRELSTAGLQAGIGLAESWMVAGLASRQVEGGVLVVEEGTIAAQGRFPQGGVEGAGSGGLRLRGATPGQVGDAALPLEGSRPMSLLRRVALEGFLEALSLGAVEMGDGLRDVLEKWGVRTLGAFGRLKRSAVGARLGVEGLRLWDRVTGREQRVVAVAEPPLEFEQSWEFEYEVDSVDPLLFLLRRFLDTLGARMRAAGKVAVVLRVELGLAYGEPLALEQKLPEPTSDAEALFRLLAGRMEGLEAESPVARLSLRIEVADFRQRQLGLFESSLKNPYRFTQTLARVAGIVGADRVGRPVLEADGRPDGFCLESLPAAAPAAAELSLKDCYGMPLRRFRPGRRAAVEFQGRQPIWFRCEGVSGFVKAARGPWMHSGRWWDEERRWNRVEWDVELNKGGVYRLVKDEEGWKVEGVY